MTSAERRDRIAKQQKYLLKGKVVTYPVMPETLEQTSTRYAPGRRWRQAAVSTSNIARPGPSALYDQEAEVGLKEEDYDQEEFMLATPDRFEEEREVLDLPRIGRPRKRRRVSPGEEEKRRAAILAHRDNRLGSWVHNSPAPATHRQMPSANIGHANEESFAWFHTDLDGYGDRSFDHSTQGYGDYSSAAHQPQTPFDQNFSYLPQIPEPQVGQRAPPLELSVMPSDGLATGDSLVNPFSGFNDTISGLGVAESQQAPSSELSAMPSYGLATGDSPANPFGLFNDTTAELGVPDRQLGGASPMQDLTWTEPMPQMELDDMIVEQPSGLFGEEDLIDWDAYEAPQ